jgi:heme-degrading monooxygenase HmoA
MFVILWEYRVRRERLPEFEAAYGPEGEWVQLFRRAEGFVETELWQDREDRTRFVSVDKWLTRQHYDAFRVRFDDEYLAIDARTEKFTASEKRLGLFEAR